MTHSGTLLPSYLQELWRLRHFWSSLVVNDIRSRYRRSILGVGWSLLRPLGMTVVFCVVFGTLFQQDIRTYAPYVLLGITAWQFIQESMLHGCLSFQIGAAYIRQQRVPLAIFPLRSVLGSAFHFFVAMLLGVVMTAVLQGIPSWPHLLFLPISFAIMFFLCWSLAIVTGVMQTHFPDTSHLLEIGMQILFYLTPIMYRPTSFPDRHRLTWILSWNPVHAVIELVRQPLLEGALPTVANVTTSLAFLAATAALAWLLLRKLERTLVFWI